MQEILREHRLAQALRSQEEDALALGDEVERQDALERGLLTDFQRAIPPTGRAGPGAK